MPIEDEGDLAMENTKPEAETDEDEALIEDLDEEKETTVKTKKIIVDDWMHLNALPPVWLRYGSFSC